MKGKVYGASIYTTREDLKAFQNSRSSHEQDRLFIDIVNHIQPKLFIKFKSYGIQNEDIEDLVQETLIRIYLALHTFDFSTDVPF